MIAAAPVILCRCCANPLDCQYQPHWREGAAGYWIVTCWTQDCPMCGQTSTDDIYPALDLSIYGVCALEALQTGATFSDRGVTSKVHLNDGRAIWLQDAGSDGIYEVPFDILTDGVYVRVIERGAPDPEMIAYIESRGWREMVGD